MTLRAKQRRLALQRRRKSPTLASGGDSSSDSASSRDSEATRALPPPSSSLLPLITGQAGLLAISRPKRALAKSVAISHETHAAFHVLPPNHDPSHTHTHTHTLETLALLSETHEKQLVCTSKETKQGKRGDGALRMIDLSTSSCCRGEGEGGGGGGERKGCKCQASATPITE